MSRLIHWFNHLLHTFPATSDIWWTVVTALFFLAILLFIIGESLWLFGVKNFTAYTWYIRFSIPRSGLIGISIGAGVVAGFLVYHFAVGRGWIAGPNTR